MLISFLTLLACQDNIQKVEEEQVEGEVYSDADGDGYLDDEDCDDNNPQINPAMEEVCNGIDDNCNDDIDEGVGTTFYLDNDGDGYGMAGVEEYACEAPEGYVPTGSDCNDNNAASFPGGEEICDGIDNDCDAMIDDDDSSLDRSSGNTYFWDSDGDGFGNIEVSEEACNTPEGYVSNSADCDDDNNTVSPESPEICDELDNDCDELIDGDDEDLDLSTGDAYYYDFDEDGYGAGVEIYACSQPNDHVNNNTDCDDINSSIFPGAPEVCDDIDNDCDFLIDDDDDSLDVNSTQTFYMDADGDGYGSDTTQNLCQIEIGLSSLSGDCDDSVATTYPGAAEMDDIAACLNDADGDGYAATSDGGSDCNDNNLFINPQVTDLFGDGIDQNCDGFDGVDADGDGDASVASGGGDCDDANDNISSIDGDGDGRSLCDGDCDDTDESLSDVDNDGDGFSTCQGDCDDNNADSYPYAAFQEADADTICFVDADGDGFASVESGGSDCNDQQDYTYPGAASQELDLGCVSDMDGDGYAPISEGGQDCDDSRLFFNPEVTDLFGDGFDQNCDGIDGLDADGDGDASIASGGGDCDDANENISSIDGDGDGRSLCDGDCDDTDESLSDVDNDGDGFSTCDGDCDDTDMYTYVGAAYMENTLLCIRDGDGDGYSSLENGGQDCDDEDILISPAEDESCDGIDNDCDDLIDDDDDNLLLSSANNYFADTDVDGFGDAQTLLQRCETPDGYVENDEDCDDGTFGINPDAIEICDDIDNDCDDLIDDNDSNLDGTTRNTFYQDLDSDGEGNGDVSVQFCAQPDGFVDNMTDCDDTSAEDLDGDGVQNCADDDADGDGLPNDLDADDLNENVVSGLPFGSGSDGQLELTSDVTVSDWTNLTGGQSSGDSSITVADSTAFIEGDELLLISQQGSDAGNKEMVFVSEISGNNISIIPPLSNDYSSSSTVIVQRIPHYTDVTIPADYTMFGSEWDGTGGGVIIFRATGDVNVDGTISVAGMGFMGGDGVFGNGYDPIQGESYLGTGSSGNTNANEGGGGAYPRRGDNADSGAGGGYGAAGGAGTNYYNSEVTFGGNSYGTSTLNDWYLGSGGGGGSPDTETDGSSGSNYSAAGGDGGGMISLYVGGTLSIIGTITADGENADSASSNSGEIGGGGGGSGGQIFIYANTIDKSGTLSAIGGQGTIGVGGGNSQYGSARGGDGGEGRIRIDYGTLNGNVFPNGNPSISTPSIGYSEIVE